MLPHPKPSAKVTSEPISTASQADSAKAASMNSSTTTGISATSQVSKQIPSRIENLSEHFQPPKRYFCFLPRGRRAPGKPPLARLGIP